MGDIGNIKLEKKAKEHKEEKIEEKDPGRQMCKKRRASKRNREREEGEGEKERRGRERKR